MAGLSPEPEMEGALPEPEVEGYSPQPEAEVEPEAEQRPDALIIIMPPLLMIFFMLIGLLLLSLYTRRVALLSVIKQRWPGFCRTDQTKTIQSEKDNEPTKQADDFLTPFDIEVLKSLDDYSNRPAELLRIAGPALLSLALCPFTLYLYTPLVNAFWTPSRHKVPPDINEAIACFLAPAGLVYATTFGFAFQQALTKQGEIMYKVTRELGLIDQILSMTTKINFPSNTHRMEIYRALKTEAIYMILQIQGRQPEQFQAKPAENIKTKLWSVMDQLREIGLERDTKTFDLDRILADNIVKHMTVLNSICSDRMGVLHSKIHPLKWAFLESLGFFSFFGILLTQTQSYRLDLTMCIITVFSISLMCYVVSDFDSPFSGFFRIDVSVVNEVVLRAKETFDQAKKGVNVLTKYPDPATTGGK